MVRAVYRVLKADVFNYQSGTCTVLTTHPREQIYFVRVWTSD